MRERVGAGRRQSVCGVGGWGSEKVGGHKLIITIDG